MQTSVCPKITSRADARNRKKDPAEAGSFYGFFVFPKLMPEIFSRKAHRCEEVLRPVRARYIPCRSCTLRPVRERERYLPRDF